MLQYFGVNGRNCFARETFEIGQPGQYVRQVYFLRDQARLPIIIVLLENADSSKTSATDNELYEPGQHQILFIRSHEGQTWDQAAEPVIERKLGRVDGMDAWADANGLIYLAWSEQQRVHEPAVIHTITFNQRKWTKPQTLSNARYSVSRPALIAGRALPSLMYEVSGCDTGRPYMRERFGQDPYSDEALRSRDRVGVFVCDLGPTGWGPGRKNRDVDSDILRESGPEVIRAGVASSRRQGPRSLWTWARTWDRNPRYDAADGRLYMLDLADDDNLVLSRTTANGPEALLLRTHLFDTYRALSNIGSIGLAVYPDEFIAAWSDPRGNRVRLMRSKLASLNWTPADKLYWQLRAGRGIGMDDWEQLYLQMCRVAEAFDRRHDAANAVKWYLRVFKPDYDDEASKRLTMYYQAGVNEARRQLWAYAAGHAKDFGAKPEEEDSAQARLLRGLGVRPDAEQARRYGSLPAQSPEEVRRLLAAWECPAFTVPLDAGREVVVRPNRWRIVGTGGFAADPAAEKLMTASEHHPGGVLTLEAFKAICTSRIPRGPDREDMIGWTRILVSYGGDCGTGYTFLRDLAEWQVRPAAGMSSTKPAGKR
jgi:hypothetical protein